VRARKTLASVFIVIAATFASTLSFAGPAAAAGWYTLKAVAGTIPAGTASILVERKGNNNPGRYCQTPSTATNAGIGVNHLQHISITAYAGSGCQGRVVYGGRFYEMPDDWADGSCAAYGIDYNYLELRRC
jgi:hypothetical protein